MKTIIITGSVGSGKTTLAKKLAEKKGCAYFDISQCIKDNKLYSAYDKKNKCYVVDTKELNKFIIKIIRKCKESKMLKCLVIDSHLSHYLPKKYVDLCIITKCSIETLNKRLKKRGYSKQKIKDNVECEIFDVCLEEAKQNKHNIKIVDTTKRQNLAKIINFIKK